MSVVRKEDCLISCDKDIKIKGARGGWEIKFCVESIKQYYQYEERDVGRRNGTVFKSSLYYPPKNDDSAVVYVYETKTLIVADYRYG